MSSATSCPSASVVRIEAGAYWCSWMPAASDVARYPARLANVRAVFGGQHDTSNQGARSEDCARGDTVSASASAPGRRWCSVFA